MDAHEQGTEAVASPHTRLVSKSSCRNRTAASGAVSRTPSASMTRTESGGIRRTPSESGVIRRTPSRAASPSVAVAASPKGRLQGRRASLPSLFPPPLHKRPSLSSAGGVQSASIKRTSSAGRFTRNNSGGPGRVTRRDSGGALSSTTSGAGITRTNSSGAIGISRTALMTRTNSLARVTTIPFLEF